MADGTDPNAEGVGTNAGTAVADAPESGEVATTAQSTEAQPSTTTPEPERSKPSIKDLLKEPDFQQEFEHRVASEAGRRAKEQLERERALWQQQEQARLERERLLSMDEYELGQQRKQELSQQFEEEQLRQRLQPLEQQARMEVMRQTGTVLFNATVKLANDAGLPKEALEKLAPSNFTSLEEFHAATIEAIAEAKAEKRVKAKLPLEVKAALEEQNAKAREGSPAPEALPPGEPGMSDGDFLAAFAAGKTNDWARAMKLTSGR